jgi:hypothetical protein
MRRSAGWIQDQHRPNISCNVLPCRHRAELASRFVRATEDTASHSEAGRTIRSLTSHSEPKTCVLSQGFLTGTDKCCNIFSQQYNCERGANYYGGSEAGSCSAGQITSWRLWRQGRKIPSFCILQIRVVRFKPSLAAAPFGPPITQPTP